MTKTVLSQNKKKQDDINRIPCPFCKELIIAGAKKCRFCKEDLSKAEKIAEQKQNFFTRKITLSGPYTFWVLSMVTFLIAIGQLSGDPNSHWITVMFVAVAIGFIAFLALIASILHSRGRYGIITLLTFILFFGILFNYDTVTSAFGLNPAFTTSNVNNTNIQPESAPNPTSTPTPTPTQPVKNRPVKSDNTNAIQSNKIECTGPDGKKFTTTQKECDEFNAAWGNAPTPDPNEYVKCNISTNCGGGYKEMTRVSCDHITCCQINGSWELRDEDQCKKEQKQQSEAEWAKICNDLYNPDDCSSYWQPGTTGLYDCRSDAYNNRIRCYENYEE